MNKDLLEHCAAGEPADRGPGGFASWQVFGA